VHIRQRNQIRAESVVEILIAESDIYIARVAGGVLRTDPLLRPSPRVCMSIHSEGKSCGHSSLESGVLVLNEHPLSWRTESVRLHAHFP